ncbi:MAG: prepilin peptidase [Lachnospiraceae bacterium]|nr:prepilin peptidase [Candidatus Equihabitans merdae]
MAGIAGHYFCEMMMPRMLKRRGREIHIGRVERIVLLVLMAVIGGLMGMKGYCYNSIPMSSYCYDSVQMSSHWYDHVQMSVNYADSLWMTSYGLILLVILEMIAVIDYHERIIPDGLWENMIILKMLCLLFHKMGIHIMPRADMVQSILGMIFCFLIFIIPGLFGKKMGAGDVKLMSSVGFFYGIEDAMMAIIFMGVAMLAYTVFHKSRSIIREKNNDPHGSSAVSSSSVVKSMKDSSLLRQMIPLGPFISFGVLCTWILPG